MRNQKKISKQNVGNAGEYYMAARLSLQNFTTTITLGRAERYDILAVSPENRTIKLSVKTRQEGARFQLNAKDEQGDNNDRDFFYVFINLHKFEETPEFWIVPAKTVRTTIISAHRKFLNRPSKNGKRHKDFPMRTVPTVMTKTDQLYYPEDWEKTLSVSKGDPALRQLI